MRNTIAPHTHRLIEQIKEITFTMDPDPIWTSFPEEWLDLLPAEPRSNDSIEMPISWIDGSCGRYTATTELLAQEPGKDFREVILRFGTLQHAVYEDRKQQMFTHKMAPLPLGR